jgi:WS/DGAT/MGAT family acyltransferase
MESLEGLDAAFLSLETPAVPLHVGAVMVLDPPEGTRSLFSPSTRYAQVRRIFAQRVHLVPPMRQRAARVPLGLHHPVWVDDPAFDIDEHLVRASLPRPGGADELNAFVADVMSRPLDPDRPLWELHVVEGLAEDRTALVAKIHHAILDGVSGASILAAFLDLTPRSRVVPLPGAWDPAPLPGPAELLRHAASSLSRQPAQAWAALQAGVEAVADIGAHSRAVRARGDAPPPGLFGAPRTSFNGSVSSRKRYATLTAPLEDVQLVRQTLGGTVNDVILAAVAGGLRRLLEWRGEDVERPLVAFVPVSTRDQPPAASRPDGSAGAPGLGNQVSGMLVSLATDVDDPVERLATISASARVAKEQEQIHRGRLLSNLAELALPGVMSRLVRAASGGRLFDRVPPPFNVVVSAVKVPDVTLFCAGSRVDALFPVGPITDGVGLNITTFSYLHQLEVGLLACRRLLPELHELAIGIDDALGELVACALDARGAVS